VEQSVCWEVSTIVLRSALHAVPVAGLPTEYTNELVKAALSLIMNACHLHPVSQVQPAACLSSCVFVQHSTSIYPLHF
jgi:hypothetical protein